MPPAASAWPGAQALSAPSDEAQPADLFVAEDGSDTADGTFLHPFRTIDRALDAAGVAGGVVIDVEPGSYPGITDALARTSDVTVRGTPGDRPRIGLSKLYGSQKLHFADVTFSDSVIVGWHLMRQADQPASDLTFTNTEFTSSTGCLKLTNALRVSVMYSLIHDCESGINGSNVQDVTLLGNRLEHFHGDAIAFTDWHRVRIAENLITDMVDPANQAHNDGIQIVGDASDVVIERNEISHSRIQLLMLTDEKGPLTNVTVVNNLLHNAGGYAVQSQAMTARYINNTIWASGGGIALRSGVYGTPTDSVFLNNIVQSMSFFDGTAAAVIADNVAQECTTTTPAEVVCGIDSPFDATSLSGFGLTPSSPYRHAGTPTGAPSQDLLGRQRTTPPALGALE